MSEKALLCFESTQSDQSELLKVMHCCYCEAKVFLVLFVQTVESADIISRYSKEEALSLESSIIMYSERKREQRQKEPSLIIVHHHSLRRANRRVGGRRRLAEIAFHHAQPVGPCKRRHLSQTH